MLADNILNSTIDIFAKSPRPFGIAHITVDDAGRPADMEYAYLNEAMAHLTDQSADELLGHTSYEIWPEGNGAQYWMDMFYRAAYCDESVEFESVSFPLERFFSVIAFPITTGYCAFEVQDMTDLLSTSFATLENVSAGLFFFDMRNRIIMLTTPAREACGAELSYLSLDRFAADVFDEESAHDVLDQVNQFIAQGTRVLCTARLKDGRWLRLSMTHTGKSERFANGFLEDNTRAVELERKSIRRSEIIESLSRENYALYLVDLDCDSINAYLMRNSTAEYFAKMVKENMAYSAWLELYVERYVCEADKNKVRSLMNRDYLLESLGNNIGDYSISCKREFGQEAQYVELRLIKLPGEGHEMVLAARNINEEILKEIRQKEALQNALDVAEHASSAKSRFLTNISHDFRTPMNSIMGFANIGLAHLDDEERTRGCFDRIILSSHHLLDLINDILDMSRIESGKISLSEESMDLSDLISDIQTMFAGQASEGNLHFNVDVSQVEHRHVVSDQLRLNQILVNTVGNAFKYTPAGGRIDLIIREGGVAPNGFGMYEVIIRDTGCGMPPEFAERIFMPFERDSLRGAGGKEGTGLGMAITKSLVDLLGGTISVKSEEGKGSEFTIMLPLRLDGASRRVRNGAPAEESDEQFEGYRVLITDDDELSREMISVILKDKGFDVDEVCDGDEAIAVMEAAPEGFYDAIIMDMRMPRMSGDEATRRIRSLPRADVKTLPIIAATADAFEEGHRRARDAGMTAHITKPLNIGELMKTLKECISASGAAR